MFTVYRQHYGEDCEQADGIDVRPCNEDRCIECVIDGNVYEEGEMVNNCTCEIWSVSLILLNSEIKT